ncbi:cyclic pyranopterin monophosphate synthase subunit MoaA [Gracilimonas mengyeensis]|uniref:Cyclic pyranopterin monophosphate synthase subunit MoaA n=2 Tax=Gracilimonas mengyeensis TaxID=1302730 RepID=A0A521BLL9_9BACT|nr:cyclic pyranopterin monophosphate synthase subunit MoaA [Gracilimonas mengyeensis]
MPEEGFPISPEDRLPSVDELMQIVSVFQEMGVDKIRITGGEPLANKQLPEILDRLVELGFENLNITTNGILLDRYIDKFLEVGLRSINVSLDTLDSDKYAKVTRRDRFEKVMQNISKGMEAGLRIKINAVMLKDFSEEEIYPMLEWSKTTPVHVRFIEFMPFNGNKWEVEKLITYQDVLDEAQKYFQIEKLEDPKHSTSKSFRVKGGKGTFAVISSMTEPFCGTCNRLRLTADGKLKNCLFSNQEADLLTALRKGHNLKELIRLSVRSKKEAHAGMENLPDMENRSMIAIGG